jgi:hypothetical protein
LHQEMLSEAFTRSATVQAEVLLGCQIHSGAFVLTCVWE